jgi:NAD kinase
VKQVVLRDGSGQLGWIGKDLSPLLNSRDVIVHTLASCKRLGEDCDGETELEIRSEDSALLGLSVDGRETLEAQGRLPIVIRTAKVQLALLRPKSLTHFDVLRSKLKWS